MNSPGIKFVPMFLLKQTCMSFDTYVLDFLFTSWIEESGCSHKLFIFKKLDCSAKQSSKQFSEASCVTSLISSLSGFVDEGVPSPSAAENVINLLEC